MTPAVHVKAKTKTECFKDPTYALFLEVMLTVTGHTVKFELANQDFHLIRKLAVLLIWCDLSTMTVVAAPMTTRAHTFGLSSPPGRSACWNREIELQRGRTGILAIFTHFYLTLSRFGPFSRFQRVGGSLGPLPPRFLRVLGGFGFKF